MGLTRVRVVILQGYLKIRTTANRKSRYKSLNIPMDEIHWDKKNEEVKKSHKDHERLNRYIQEEKRKHILYGNLPSRTLQGEPDIVAYFQRHINNTPNSGTKEVRKATLKKFVGYLQQNNLQELKFSDLSGEHIHNFYNHLCGQVSPNTAAHHIRMFKVVINKAIIEGRVHYPINPFATLKNKMRRVEPEIHGLSTLEISQLIQEHHFRPNKHIAAFLFSLFAQGLRKSDMIQLRWENFDYHYDKLYCSFVVKKTKKPTKIELSEMAVYYLVQSMEFYYPELKDEVKSLNKEERKHRREVQRREDLLNEITNMKDGEKAEFVQKWNSQASTNSGNNEVDFYKSIDEVKKQIEYYQVCVKEYGEDIYRTIAAKVQALAISKPKEFVFDYLKGYSIPKFISDKEWKLIDNKSKLYNYHLRKAGTSAGFKKLTPHLARHSYARMLDENNISIQTIQKLMFHSHPQHTTGYIRRLNKSAENDANIKLAEQFKDVRFRAIP